MSSVPEHAFPALSSSPDNLRVLGFPTRLVRLEQLVAHLRLVLAVRGGACVWEGTGEKARNTDERAIEGAEASTRGRSTGARFGERGGAPRTRQRLETPSRTPTPPRVASPPPSASPWRRSECCREGRGDPRALCETSFDGKRDSFYVHPYDAFAAPWLKRRLRAFAALYARAYPSIPLPRSRHPFCASSSSSSATPPPGSAAPPRSRASTSCFRAWGRRRRPSGLPPRNISLTAIQSATFSDAAASPARSAPGGHRPQRHLLRHTALRARPRARTCACSSSTRA